MQKYEIDGRRLHCAAFPTVRCAHSRERNPRSNRIVFQETRCSNWVPQPLLEFAYLPRMLNHGDARSILNFAFRITDNCVFGNPN